MGADIHSYAETKDASGVWRAVEWESDDKWAAGPFDWRSYHLFGWRADVRNYSAVPPIDEPRGLPDDVSAKVRDAHEGMHWDAHSASWFTTDELLAFDYDQQFEDRRVTRNGDGGVTAEPGGGEMTTYREFLGPAFFTDLDRLRALNEQAPTRIVFWFDN
ncbi:MAG: hypothetical protein K0Q93_3320 [Nocardioidaceae bacterium]|nr:hypothetical protein [Nocardioidaceae bacterium]